MSRPINSFCLLISPRRISFTLFTLLPIQLPLGRFSAFRFDLSYLTLCISSSSLSLLTRSFTTSKVLLPVLSLRDRLVLALAMQFVAIQARPYTRSIVAVRVTQSCIIAIATEARRNLSTSATRPPVLVQPAIQRRRQSGRQNGRRDATQPRASHPIAPSLFDLPPPLSPSPFVRERKTRRSRPEKPSL